MKYLHNIANVNCLDMFTTFYNIPSKNEQYLYIQGLIDPVDVKKRCQV